MSISIADIRGRFTKTLIDVYQERIAPTSFLRSFFKTTTAPTKTVAIEVERMGEKVAVDVVRGTEGNRNTFSKSTEKIYEPPLFREYFDATQLDLYDRVLGSQGNANAPLFAMLMNSVADRLGLLQDKIERAKEIQCAQVFMTGIITMKNGDNIDFKRKAASLVDLGSAGGYWATNNDLFAQLQAGCNFLRTVGKSGDAVFNCILGDTAIEHMFKNTVFTARQNLFSMALDRVNPPQRTAIGSVYHGRVTAGPYLVDLWSYPQYYDDPITSVSTPYIDAKKGVLMPANPRLVMAHAAVPQLIGEPGQMPTQGEYVVGEFTDIRKAVHDFDIQSAPIAIPVAVDQMYTFKAVA